MRRGSPIARESRLSGRCASVLRVSALCARVAGWVPRPGQALGLRSGLGRVCFRVPGLGFARPRRGLGHALGPGSGPVSRSRARALPRPRARLCVPAPRSGPGTWTRAPASGWWAATPGSRFRVPAPRTGPGTRTRHLDPRSGLGLVGCRAPGFGFVCPRRGLGPAPGPGPVPGPGPAPRSRADALPGPGSRLRVPARRTGPRARTRPWTRAPDLGPVRFRAPGPRLCVPAPRTWSGVPRSSAVPRHRQRSRRRPQPYLCPA